jgi:hypothetical protein
MSEGYVAVGAVEDDADCAMEAERLYLSGHRPITIHRLSAESADAVTKHLQGRPSRLPVRRSSDDETAEQFAAAIQRHPNVIHVYWEPVCDVCKVAGDPKLFHVSCIPGLFCRTCAYKIAELFASISPPAGTA